MSKTEDGLPGRLLADLGNDMQIRECALVRDLHAQPYNPQVMSREHFNTLVANIGRRGLLESMPYVVLVEDRLDIVSGHHRLKAALTAGLEAVPVLVDTSGLTRSEVVAKQIAHNEIHGNPDKHTVAQLLQEIESVEDLLMTGLDSENLPQIEDRGLTPIGSLDPIPEWQTMILTMLPDHFEKFTEWLEASEHDRQADSVAAVAPEEVFDAFKEALFKFSAHRQVLAAGTVVGLLAETALDEATAAEALRWDGEADERPAYLRPDVPWAAVFHSHRLPADAAERILLALDHPANPLEALLERLGA